MMLMVKVMGVRVLKGVGTIKLQALPKQSVLGGQATPEASMVMTSYNPAEWGMFKMGTLVRVEFTGP